MRLEDGVADLQPVALDDLQRRGEPHSADRQPSRSIARRGLRRLRGRRSLSAGILTVLTPFLVLVPISVLGVVFAGQVARLLQYLHDHSSLFSYAELLDSAARIPLVGSAVDWGLNFGIIPPTQAFVAYAERMQARPRYKAAKAVDNALIAEMKK